VRDRRRRRRHALETRPEGGPGVQADSERNSTARAGAEQLREAAARGDGATADLLVAQEAERQCEHYVVQHLDARRTLLLLLLLLLLQQLLLLLLRRCMPRSVAVQGAAEGERARKLEEQRLERGLLFVQLQQLRQRAQATRRAPEGRV
jgi:hypothetical protein